MSASSNPSGGNAAAEDELLAQLGLPPSASPEDVDQLHLAVSQYLAAAPSGIKGWAHAQAAALDEAYLTLTDPVGLQGSALRSPARPPAVVPGGPATPPARRDPVPEVPVVAAAVAAEAAVAATAVSADGEPGAEAAPVDDTDTDDLDALYASVTPGAHRDLVSGGKSAQPVAASAKPAKAVAAYPVAAAPAAATSSNRRQVRANRAAPAPVVLAQPNPGPWKWVAIATSALLGIVVVFGVVVPFVFNLGSAGNANAANGSGGGTAQASPTTPAIDQAQVSALMAKVQANPKDTASLQALGDLFFAGQQFDQAATFYDQLLALDPKNIAALLARGATYYNSGDTANAEKTWKVVVSLDPKNQEAHYDLGFLYLNSATPNFPGVQAEWTAVIAIDPTTQLAQTVQQHLDSMVAASMIPAPSGSAGASAAPSGSAGASAAPSSAPSVAPSGSPAASASTKP